MTLSFFMSACLFYFLLLPCESVLENTLGSNLALNLCGQHTDTGVTVMLS